jgi:hypothetical protein
MKFKSIQIPFTFIHGSTLALALTAGSFIFSACSSDDPQKEDVPELITKVTLTFTPTTGGDPVVATATDPDGTGVQSLKTSGPITLAKGTAYTLELALINELAKPTDPEYDITAEVEEEGVEHMFFYSWTNNVFADPAGNGNVDNRTDAVAYEDKDGNGLPIGLHTAWTSVGAVANGKFQVLLKHQPGLKSATSTSADGEDDLNVTFDIEVK